VITAAALAATVATGLTACQAQVGAAAFVGNTRISESDVTRYVGPSATTFSVTNSDGSTQSINPKTYALGFLIIDTLLAKTFAASKDGPPTSSQLAGEEAAVLSGSTNAELVSGLTSRGFTPAFATLYLDVNEKYGLLGSETNDSGDGSAVAASISKLNAPVRVNGRYGTWNASQLSLVAAGAPSFLKSVALVPND